MYEPGGSSMRAVNKGLTEHSAEKSAILRQPPEIYWKWILFGNILRWNEVEWKYYPSWDKNSQPGGCSQWIWRAANTPEHRKLSMAVAREVYLQIPNLISCRDNGMQFWFWVIQTLFRLLSWNVRVFVLFFCILVYLRRRFGFGIVNVFSVYVYRRARREFKDREQKKKKKKKKRKEKRQQLITECLG